MRSITGAILTLAAAVLVAGGMAGAPATSQDTLGLSSLLAFPVGVAGITILIWGLRTEGPPRQ